MEDLGGQTSPKERKMLKGSARSRHILRGTAGDRYWEGQLGKFRSGRINFA
jgi:hypothetical protein